VSVSFGLGFGALNSAVSHSFFVYFLRRGVFLGSLNFRRELVTGTGNTRLWLEP